MSTIPLNLVTDNVVLPEPRLPGKASLLQALQRRRSIRAFQPQALELAQLSSLLWAAAGINRPDTGGRTAPSAHNWHEIAIHALLAEGSYLYDPRANQLLLVTAEDLRRHSGVQDFVAGAPLNLVYVADFSLMTETRDEDKPFLAGADAGFIAQNVYLYCAAAGLGAVVRGLVDRRLLAHALGLKPTQRITLAQSVGYPQPAA